MRQLGVFLVVAALAGLAGCTDNPEPQVTQTSTMAPSPSPAQSPVTSPDASATPSPSPSAAPLATAIGNLFESGVGFTVEATQTAESSTDAAGNVVTYDAINVVDGDPATAWRKKSEDWAGTDYLLFTFDTPVKLTEVGLIPGYAKKDPSSGTDRFTQNHRLSYVVWEFSDGTSWQQQLDSTEPTMQTVPVAATVTWVRLGGLSTAWDEDPPATRDYLAISDVTLVGVPVQP